MINTRKIIQTDIEERCNKNPKKWSSNYFVWACEIMLLERLGFDFIE